MKSQVLVFDGVKKLKFKEENIINPGKDELLVKTLFSGISTGTEMSVYRGTAPFLEFSWNRDQRVFKPLKEDSKGFYPLNGGFGYEQVGEVLESGSDEFTSGDFIWGSWGHRTHTCLSASTVAGKKFPEATDLRFGVFNKIGSIAYNAVLDSNSVLGETAVVYGLGVPGLLAARLLILSGVRVIAVDPLESRRKKAENFGAVKCCSPEEAESVCQNLTLNKGCDLALEFSGSYVALNDAIRNVCYNGRVVAAGFYQGGGNPLQLGMEFHHNRIQIISSQVFDVNPVKHHNWSLERMERLFLEMQKEGKVDALSLVSHVKDFSEAPEAFAMLDQQIDDPMQIVLEMSDQKY